MDIDPVKHSIVLLREAIKWLKDVEFLMQPKLPVQAATKLVHEVIGIDASDQVTELLRQSLHLLKDAENSSRPVKQVERARALLQESINILEYNPNKVYAWTIKRTGDSSMKLRDGTLSPLVPGSSAHYTATPVPANANLPTPPVWSTSDPVNAPITVDPTNPEAVTVNPPANADTSQGAINFTLTINSVNADSTTATGSITDQVVPTPPPPPTDATAWNILRDA
jgi:hypothetical protein